MPKMAISAAGTVLTEDLYWQGTLLGAMEQFTIAPSFIRDHLFPGEDITDADSIVIDYYKAGNRLAPFETDISATPDWTARVSAGPSGGQDRYTRETAWPARLSTNRPQKSSARH